MTGASTPASHRWILWAAFIALLGLGLVANSLFRPHPAAETAAGTASGTSPKSANRQLLLGVDGVSWDVFQYAQAHGLFKRFTHAGRMIAPYPAMSHGAWTEIIGTRRAFGDRGRLPTVEARWFDLDAQRVADDPRLVFARYASPFNYMRAFDSYFDPLLEPLMYFPGHRVFDRELEETERAILDGFTGDRYAVYISGTDAMAHTHKDQLHAFLVQVDAMIERTITTLEARGGPVDVWMVSDHGNAGAFREGETESYLSVVSLSAAIKRAGLVRRDSGSVTALNEVAVVTIALASMVDLYLPDLSRRRRLVDEVMRERGVTLATWLEVNGTERSIIVRAPADGEAEIRWRHPAGASANEYAYIPRRGNPLAIADTLHSTTGSVRWVSDDAMRRATVDGPWPDAIYRLVSSAEKQVENAPDLIVNLGDGYAHEGEFGRVVRMVRTHGSLSARSSLGIVASTRSPVPTAVRADQVASVMHVTPRELLRSAAWLNPTNIDSTAEALASASAMLPTGHADHSEDADFLRRVKPIVQSIGYFEWTRLRGLPQAMQSPDASSKNVGGIDWEANWKKLSKTEVLLGLSHGVDTLLALTDSLDPAKIDARLTLAADRVRGISELRPLAEIRDDFMKRRDQGARALATGGGANARSAAMLTWTIPFFMQAALDIPESDSMPDPRDLSFARSWRRSQRRLIREHPERLLGSSQVGAALFKQVFAERLAWQRIEPANIPLLYDPELSDITAVLVPGIYGELFDGELWQRGLRAVRDKLGVRTLSVHADGRCSSAINAVTILAALKNDTRRRIERGYARPRYLLLGYSKGGVDATEALLADSAFAHDQVTALVTIATPHLGSPVAERTELPEGLLSWASRDSIPTACKTDGSASSLFPATRRAFWADNADRVAERTRLFSLAFTTDVHDAHPWMKITKQIGQFPEANDGVVALSAARFPATVPAVDLGAITGDHIAGITASAFPQEAFLEAVVVTLGELGALSPQQERQWASARTSWRLRPGHTSAAATLAPAFAASLRPRAVLPGGSAGWTPGATFRLLEASSVQDRGIRAMTPAGNPAGFAMRCDQRTIGEFRREYEFVYDAGNGGHEGDLFDGFSIVADKGSSTGRACHLATQQSAIKMTTVSVRFRPSDYPSLDMHLRVASNVHEVDVSTKHRGVNDNAFKLWFVVRDTRKGATNSTRLFGYAWTSLDRDGVRSPDGGLREAASSRRNLVVTTLPEAWLVTIGDQKAGGAWQRVVRDLAGDLSRAYPGVPVGAFEVVGITIQSDSDESREMTDVYVEEIKFGPRASPQKK